MLAATASGLTAMVLSAPMLAGNHPFAALALRDFFSSLCHQNPARSFFFKGSAAAVCVRCLGIYCGIAMGAWLEVISVARLSIEPAFARRIFLGALLLNGMDVAAEALRLHGNLPLPRLLLGALLGVAAGVLLCREGSSKSKGRSGQPGLTR